MKATHAPTTKHAGFNRKHFLFVLPPLPWFHKSLVNNLNDINSTPSLSPVWCLLFAVANGNVWAFAVKTTRENVSQRVLSDNELCYWLKV